MKILITGGSGFIGQPVIQKLIENHTILALSRYASVLGKKKHGANIQWVNSSLQLNEATLSSLKDFKPEVIIHLAWEKIPNFSFETSFENLDNHILFFNDIFKIPSVKKIIVAGSCFEYNQKIGECTETDKCISTSYFTWAKNTLRDFLQFECLRNQISLAWVRIFYVYGPNQRDGALIPTIIKNLLSNEVPDLRKPDNANDFIYVDDVAEGFKKMVEQDIVSGIYNLGSGEATPVVEVLRIIEKNISDTDKITNSLLSTIDNAAPEINFWANMKKMDEKLNFHPLISLKEGVEKMINTYKTS